MYDTLEFTLHGRSSRDDKSFVSQGGDDILVYPSFGLCSFKNLVKGPAYASLVLAQFVSDICQLGCSIVADTSIAVQYLLGSFSDSVESEDTLC